MSMAVLCSLLQSPGMHTPWKDKAAVMDSSTVVAHTLDEDDDLLTFSDYFESMERLNDDPVTPTRVSSPSPISCSIDYEVISDSDADGSVISDFARPQNSDLKRSGKHKPSSFESLPSELIQHIASYALSDEDLTNLSLSSPIIAAHLMTDNSNVWRHRFLSLYDFPLIDRPHEFSIAYKLRRLVLRKFENFGSIGKNKSKVQLEVIRDMVLETYNPHKAHLTSPIHSKNLAALASIGSSSWTIELASSFLYRNYYEKYGHPHPLFDALQVLLSHLILSRKSGLVLHASASRDDYDLVRVYHFKKPLQSILRLTPIKSDEAKFRSPRFPNLRKPATLSASFHFEVNMHDLLHIRNFWQRQLIDSTIVTSEHAYSTMSKTLDEQGINPQKWQSQLQSTIPLNLEWYGHYSCLHPWPKTREAIDERQTCAEDWGPIDPMVLNFETSNENEENSFWPPLFDAIPLLKDMLLPEKFFRLANITFIRGIASFHTFGKLSDAPQSVKWHPFKGLRLHGFVHDIPAQITFGDVSAQARAAKKGDNPIPGWKHIVIVLYKPSSRSLLSVLEHAEEDYGGTTNTNFNTADIWNDEVTQDVSTDQTTSEPTSSPESETTGTSTTESDGSDSQDTIDSQIEAELKKLLEVRIETFTSTYTRRLIAQSKQEQEAVPDNPFIASYDKKATNPHANELPPIWSPAHIRQLDDAFSPVQYMAWNDGTIEFAYAYEGIIIPGGKIMMGRFWRVHGIDGLGPGKEVGPDAVGVELRPVQLQNTPTTSASSFDSDQASTQTNVRRRRSRRARSRSYWRTKNPRRRGDPWTNEESDDYEDDETDEFTPEKSKPKEQEYEYVTMVNGEESRAANAQQGLDRGPFIFWAG